MPEADGEDKVARFAACRRADGAKGLGERRASRYAEAERKVTMPVRLKKLIGTFVILALVVVYALVAVTVATYRLVGAPWWAQFLYFLLSGLLWIVPAMFVISWMAREPRRKRSSGA